MLKTLLVSDVKFLSDLLYGCNPNAQISNKIQWVDIALVLFSHFAVQICAEKAYCCSTHYSSIPLPSGLSRKGVLVPEGSNVVETVW